MKRKTPTPKAVSYDTAQPTITTEQYEGLQKAFDFLNARLFTGELPQVLITLQRHANARGYFAPNRFAQRSGSNTAHELALNPDTFENRTDREIISTLAHEMAHVWQEAHGTPPRRCYHNHEWAEKMKAIGLQPSATGQPGGKETGQQMTHYIIEGGPFAQAWDQLLKTGFALNWQSPAAAKAARAKKAASKTKYTCPDCEQNAWAKPGSNLKCGDCDEPMEENS